MTGRKESNWAPVGVLLLCLACVTAGCALLAKGHSLDVRYFNLPTEAASKPVANALPLRLRLGRVSAARHIDLRFISRRGPHELTFYDELRWTDQPASYLRQRLNQHLFERAGITRALSAPAPTLEVELLAFDELRSSGPRRAQVAAFAAMHDERAQIWQQTFQVESEIGGGESAEALVDALARALSQVAKEVAARALATLSADSSASPRQANFVD